MAKVLIIYYSFEGNTKKLAELLAEKIEGDLYEIKPKKEMKSKGFSKYFWGGSQVVMGKKPEIEELKIDFDHYEKILVGSPIWAGNYAPPIKTLLEDGYIKGKEVGYFYTHEGGPGKSLDKGERVISQDNHFIGGKGFIVKRKSLESIKGLVDEWVKTLSI